MVTKVPWNDGLSLPFCITPPTQWLTRLSVPPVNHFCRFGQRVREFRTDLGQGGDGREKLERGRELSVVETDRKRAKNTQEKPIGGRSRARCRALTSRSADSLKRWKLPERNPLRNNTLFSSRRNLFRRRGLLRSRPFRPLRAGFSTKSTRGPTNVKNGSHC